MNIIPADVHHLDAAAALLDQYRIHSGQLGDLPEARHYLFSRLTCHDSIVFLALDEAEQPIGFIQLYPSFSSKALRSVLILSDLFVIPEARHRGTATRLVEAAMGLARERGDHGLIAETTKNNPAAQHLYTSIGFRREAQHERYYLPVA
jgi:ribosomal protein S18 acetylase RimI-like enzyme